MTKMDSLRMGLGAAQAGAARYAMEGTLNLLNDLVGAGGERC